MALDLFRDVNYAYVCSTRGLLYRGVIVTVNSGFWTAVLAFIDVILVRFPLPSVCISARWSDRCILQMWTQGQALNYTVIELPMGTLYFISLLSNLNARGYIRGRATDWNEYLSAFSVAHPRQDTMGGGPNVSQGIQFVLSDLQSQTASPTVDTKASSTGTRVPVVQASKEVSNMYTVQSLQWMLKRPRRVVMAILSEKTLH